MSGTTLTDWLRARDDRALAALLRARPDLATPPPADTAVLATRAGTRASVARAAESLDTLTLAVLDALLVAGADRAPLPLERVRLDAPPGRLADGVERLRELAVAWGPDDALSVVPAAREVSGADVVAALGGVGDDERAVLEHLARSGGVGQTKDAAEVVPLDRARTPVQRLLARGLLLTNGKDTVELPRPLAQALLGPPPLVEPVPRTDTHRPGTVDSTAAGEAMESLRHMETLLRLWSDDPPPVLKAGGVGVRDLRRLTKVADITERQAGLLAELAVGASLVADSEAATPEWVPTNHADSWLSAGPATRWATLASAWVELPRVPGLVGARDAKDRLLAPLSDDLRRPAAPLERARVLRFLADLPPGRGVSAPDELAALLAWRAPRRGGRMRDDVVRWTLAEATSLGLVALGAISGPGRAMIADGPAAATRAMAEAMPEPIDHVLVQADLTVVAPGPLEPHLAAMVNEVADVESAGGATVYRVSETSIRRALDAGRTAGDLHELFRSRSRTPVPQSLEYLIDDVARRHGRLRGGAAASFLRCDDPGLLAEVVAHQAAAALQLRKIAPTVAVSPLPLVEVLEDLRAAGFAPVAEAADGSVIDLRPSGKRVRVTPRARRIGPTGLPDDRLEEIVAAVRAGDRAAESRRGRAVTAPSGQGARTAETVEVLQDAARDARAVWIGLVDGHGVASQRVITPLRVGGGVVEGVDPSTGEVRRLQLHRITTVALVE